MKKPNWKELIDRLMGIYCVAWFLAPIGKIAATGEVLRAFSLPLQLMKNAPLAPWVYISFLVYLVPLYGLFKIAQLFLSEEIKFFSNPSSMGNAGLRIATFMDMIFCFLAPFLYYGNKPVYYGQIPVLAYVGLGLNVAALCVTTGLALYEWNLLDPLYQEYQNQRKAQGRPARGKKTDDRHNSFVEIFFQIRAKLLLSFISIILIIIVSLAGTLLLNYHSTIVKAVADGARSQVEQSASIYKVNLGDSLAMLEYMSREKQLNEKAEFKFQSMTVYTNRKEEIFLDKLDPSKLPAFQAEFSTLAVEETFPQSIPALGAGKAKDYATVKDSASFKDNKARTFTFVAPITTPFMEKSGGQKIKHDRLLGFSVMEYSQDEVLKPYIHIRAIVFVLAGIFIYLAIILVFVVGNFIVNPLLFLKMNVRKISENLRSMIRGESRVSAGSLVYDDCVTSRDEIKSLSGEIGDMVTVIRGIIPYISASTLKQAETGEASSRQKELAFLFTDIRGFTTLCEGLQPQEVVTILNHYLDAQTEIILNNHGDIDKFVGDEMMAVFDGPNKELNACRAAMQIRSFMEREKETRRKAGLPTVDVGIGINSGAVVFGSVGARERMDFTSIGDTVNLAARLEGANKAYGSKSIITEVVYDLVKDELLCRELDFIAVKGKTQPVRIYEILQELSKASPEAHELKKNFETGLAFYRKQNWEKAGAAFAKNVTTFSDMPSQVFLDRISVFEKKPPEKAWDGVFRMTVK
jgi:class 3 adenylate cyclase